MKAKITRTVIEEGKEVYTDVLYVFSSSKEAQKGLVHIINKCRYRIVSKSKNGFTCDKGFSQLVFNIEKQ